MPATHATRNKALIGLSIDRFGHKKTAGAGPKCEHLGTEPWRSKQGL